MSQHHDKEELIDEELTQEAQEIAKEYESQEEIIEQQDETIASEDSQITKLQDLLARNQADYENFKKRTARDKDEMIFFLKSDIFKKILPRLDDLERIIKNTPVEIQDTPIYEWVLALEKTLRKDISGMGIQKFKSIGQNIDPEKHDVMTQVPGEHWIIIDEFESGYMLWDKVLRVAKVVVWNG